MNSKFISKVILYKIQQHVKTYLFDVIARHILSADIISVIFTINIRQLPDISAEPNFCSFLSVFVVFFAFFPRYNISTASF